MTIASIIAISKNLIEWTEKISSSLSEKEKNHLDALHAVQNAVAITRSYIAHLDRGNSRDYDKEEKLSKTWNSAGNHLYKVGELRLANKCGFKGYYWASPDSWNEEKFPEAEIELDKVFSDVQNLLQKYV